MQISRYRLRRFIDKTVSVDVDYKRRLYSFLAFSYIGSLILLGFSFRDFGLENNWVFVITLTAAVAILANLIIYYTSRRLTLCCIIGSSIIISMCLMLVYHGGVDNTALYWIFPFPIIVFVLLGFRHGAIANSVMFVLLIYMLMHPELLLAKYEQTESIRFIASLFVLNIVNFINEYYRNHSHSVMTEINLNKEQQANTDSLTNLPNRRFVDSVFLPASRTNHNNAFPMVLIMADVDNFKALNDNYGHPVGDRVLEQLARTIENNTRAEDIVARIGGEEFLLLFSNTQYETGLKIAEKIRVSIESMTIEHKGKTFSITMSFGVVIAETYADIEAKMKSADDKLYQAKHAGRNCVV